MLDHHFTLSHTDSPPYTHMICDTEIILRPEDTENEIHIYEEAGKSCGVAPNRIRSVEILRRSLDARKHPAIYRLKLAVYCDDDHPKERHFKDELWQSLYFNPVTSHSPTALVIGAGPAGIFSAITLLKRGIRPFIIEQGKDIHARKRDVAFINRGGEITGSNWCFGEGGAGTFTDGKLYTRSSKRGNIKEVLEIMVAHGADPDILFETHAHIGTDKLPSIMESMRKTIEHFGGKYFFETTVCDFITKGNSVCGVITEQGDKIEGAGVILATGHSARSIYRLFARKQWLIEAKPFAMGLRVEHPQTLINQIQYHSKHYSDKLPPAAYGIVEKTSFNQDVFSFCMCPGGIIVPAATKQGEMVVNGMSNSRRNSKFANAGMVTSIFPDLVPDYMKTHGTLGLLQLQEDLEKQMFLLGGKNQKAPAQRLTDFCEGRTSQSLPPCSYFPGLTPTELHAALPAYIAAPLREALKNINRKMRGFYTEEAVVVGIESRTSSPLRLPRNKETLQHVQYKGLFPCGEGAGYAGGITSSAMDGIACANALANMITRNVR